MVMSSASASPTAMILPEASPTAELSTPKLEMPGEDAWMVDLTGEGRFKASGRCQGGPSSC